MDMAAMNKRVLFIPTPGQTEQEYLATYLMEQNRAYSVVQNELNLPNDLLRLLDYKPLGMQNQDLDESIKNALNRL
jgi:UDP-N-acetylglucosamine:LPS N-acetylglucosamine transferase